MKNFKLYVTCIFLVFSIMGCISEKPTPPINNTPLANPNFTQTISVTESSPKFATDFPTLTQMPNIMGHQTKELLSDWLRNNGGCELPCLFGLPNRVSGEIETNKFLEYFSSEDFTAENEDFQVVVDKDLGLINMVINISKEKIMSVFFMSKWANKTDKKLLHIEILSGNSYELDFEDEEGVDLVSYYSLNNVLKTYGIPSQVLIAPFPTDPNYPTSIYPFSLVLYYEKSGFLIQYVSMRQEINNNYAGCQPTTYIDIFTWLPQHKLSVMEATSNLSGVGINNLNFSYFKKLEDATPFTLMEFYEFFNSTGHKCLETPKTLWTN